MALHQLMSGYVAHALSCRCMARVTPAPHPFCALPHRTPHCAGRLPDSPASQYCLQNQYCNAIHDYALSMHHANGNRVAIRQPVQHQMPATVQWRAVLHDRVTLHRY